MNQLQGRKKKKKQVKFSPQFTILVNWGLYTHINSYFNVSWKKKREKHSRDTTIAEKSLHKAFVPIHAWQSCSALLCSSPGSFPYTNWAAPMEEMNVFQHNMLFRAPDSWKSYFLLLIFLHSAQTIPRTVSLPVRLGSFGSTLWSFIQQSHLPLDYVLAGSSCSRHFCWRNAQMNG